LADNTILNSGSGGDTLRTDDISGVKYPVSKIALGADGVDDGLVALGNPLPVSAATLPLPSGASTAARQDTGNTSLASIDGKTPALGQAVAGSSVPVVLPAAQIATLTPPAAIAGFATEATLDARTGALTETAPVSDTASSGLNGRLQRIAQRLTALIALLPGSLGQKAKAASLAVVIASDQDTLAVSLASVPAHNVTNAGTFAVQESGGALTALQLLDDTVFSDDAAFTPGTSKVGVAGFIADETATDSVDEGDAGAARMTLDRKQIVTILPHTAGGLTMHKAVSAASTNATSLKASAGQIYGIQVFNVNAAARYLKLYNKATAPTVGTDTPVKTIMIPGNTAGAGAVIAWPPGIAFGTGIAYALTTGIADSDTGAVAASELVVNIDYA
jgi:hypothetical protein